MIRNQHYKFFIASCDESGGILSCEFKNGTVEIISQTLLDRPMYMSICQNKMYIILRAPFRDNNYSGIVSFDIENERLVNKSEVVSTGGVVACHLCVLDGNIYCTNYLSGSVTKLCDKLVTHSGKGKNPDRQEMPHTHYINSFDGKYLLCTDLGTDEIYTYDKDLREISRVSVPEGHGARHLSFANDCVYCANELGSTVSFFKYNEGILRYINTVSTLPENMEVESTVAAIRIKDDYLYVSNRGHDSITVFRILDNTPKFITTVNCGGRCPRDFNVFGDLLVCTNEKSDNVTFFSLRNGIPEKLDCELKIKSPLCVIGGNI